MSHLTLVPAYGRDYKNGYDARADFESGKDFQIATFGPDDGRYVNAPQLAKGTSIVLRFARLTKLISFKVGDTPPKRRVKERATRPM